MYLQRIIFSNNLGFDSLLDYHFSTIAQIKCQSDQLTGKDNVAQPIIRGNIHLPCTYPWCQYCQVLTLNRGQKLYQFIFTLSNDLFSSRCGYFYGKQHLNLQMVDDWHMSTTTILDYNGYCSLFNLSINSWNWYICMILG